MAGERPDYNQLAAIQGLEGTTLRVVAVDASGQIIMVPRGAGGNYMSVDASGYLSSIMKGLDGVTLRTIAVDGSGNILGLLQGDYMGTVKTLAVDAQGRMLAVLTDPEDVFGNPHYMGAAELAVRLGSISAHERQGNVIWQDGFESGTLGRWILDLVGAASSIGLSTLKARTGAFSLRLEAGGTMNNTAAARVKLPYPVLGGMGFEYAFELETANLTHFEGLLYLYTGANRHSVGVRYDPTTEKVQYLNSGGTFTDLASGVSPEQGCFHVVKMVADFSTGKYIRVIFDDQVFDLSAQSVRSAASAVDPTVTASVAQLTDAATTSEPVYVDNAIVTNNEV
jgi:hypothetical protein